MSRWVSFLIFAIIGLALFWCGLQMPAHLRAVDGVVLRKIGSGTPSLVDQGVMLTQSNQLGAAQLFLAAARTAWISNSPALSEAVESLAARQSTMPPAGHFGDLLQPRRSPKEPSSATATEPFAGFIILTDNRTKALDLLRKSPNPLTQELLRLRTLTNTVLFPTSGSMSGQAFDAAIAISGLLNEEGYFSASLSNGVLALATQANRGGNSQPVEDALMDLLSLGHRFDGNKFFA